MGKQAILFKLLVEYFGESEESIESYIISNVEKRISILLKEIINKISNSKRRKSAVVSKVSKISIALDKIGVLIEKAEKGKSIDGIKLIKYLIRIVTSLQEGATVSSQKISDMSNYFDKIRNLETRASGLSDTSIDRMKKDENMWSKSRIINLYIYWFEPLYEDENNFINDFGAFLNNKLTSNKESNKMSNEIQTIYAVKDFLQDQDKDIDCNCFWQLFKRMRMEIGEAPITAETSDVLEYIVDEIKNAFNNNTPESVGLCEDEVEKIISDLVIKLKDDLTVYCKKDKNHIKIVKKENFRALIRYRLCNKLYYYINDGQIYRMLAFRIFQEEFPGNICIHPAAKVDGKVFISSYVMIGKQCHIHSESYLNDHVCLFPFKSYEKEMEDAYIIIGEGSILEKYTQIIGAVEVGKCCYINFNGIISKDIEEFSKVGPQNEVCKMKESDYLEILSRVKGEIYE